MSTPFVDLPIGATKDRVSGSLDFLAKISNKKTVFAPGLLAAANRGITRQNLNHSSSNHDEDEKKIKQLIYESNKNDKNLLNGITCEDTESV